MDWLYFLKHAWLNRIYTLFLVILSLIFKSLHELFDFSMEGIPEGAVFSLSSTLNCFPGKIKVWKKPLLDS